MTPIILASSGGNHPPDAYASALARTVFQIAPDLAIDRAVAAQKLLGEFTHALAPCFAEVLARETDMLNTYPDHCDRTYDYLAEPAERMVYALQALACGTPWEAKIIASEWFAAALNTVASHLASAIHVERLLFGDSNPNNQSAAAYRARSTGAS